MAEEPAEPTKPARRTRTAEVADAISEATTRVGRLSPQQVLTVIAVGVLGFVCALQAFQVWSERAERREATRERQTWSDVQVREQNAQSELTRQHCAREGHELRGFFGDQNDKRMRFEADERAKDRATLQAMAARMADLERALRKNE